MSDSGAAPLSGAHWQRHELLWIDPAAWGAVIAPTPFAAHPLLARWAERGWPVIMRRRQPCDAADRLPVGVPFPPDEGKLRIDLQVAHRAVRSRRPPLPLTHVASSAPVDWQTTLAELNRLGARHAVEPAPFGSLLWQHLTGQRYLSPTSDLDLLWSLCGDCEIGALLAGIAAIERVAPMRIDGEIILPDGGAVNWRREGCRVYNERGHTRTRLSTLGLAAGLFRHFKWNCLGSAA